MNRKDMPVVTGAGRCCRVVFLAGVLLAACTASAPPVTQPPAEPGEKPLELTIPETWDDRVLGRVKQGRPPRHVIVLAGITGQDKLHGKTDVNMEEMLTRALTRTGRFDVAGSDRFRRALDLAGTLPDGKKGRNAALAAAAERLDAEMIVSGRILSADYMPGTGAGIAVLGAEVVMHVSGVFSASGEEAFQEDIRMNGTSTADTPDPYRTAALAVVAEATGKVAASFPLLGFVIQVNGPDVYLDIGEPAGIRNGDVFICFRIGDEVTDPGNGNHLGWSRRILGAVKVVDTGPRMSGGTIIKKTGPGEIMLGDLVIAR